MAICQTGGGGTPLPNYFRFFPVLLKNDLKNPINAHGKNRKLPNLAKGGGGTPTLVKRQTISGFFLMKASLREGGDQKLSLKTFKAEHFRLKSCFDNMKGF